MMARAGDWMQTYSGRQFWPLDPQPDEVDIVDIAHALSMMCRYNGHCKTFYSVAEHSVLVSRNVAPQFALWGLLHDASEAYVADIIRPVKPHLANYKAVEANIMAAICAKFKLPMAMPTDVKRADNAILADEMQQIMAKPPADWNLTEPPLGVRIDGVDPNTARARFMRQFAECFE
jgi:hypothetical protein